MELSLKEVRPIIEHIIFNNRKLQKEGKLPLSLGIQSVPGLGKTSLIELIAKELDLNYIKLNLAQITDVAEICGWPYKEHYVCKEDECCWIPSELLEAYSKAGWKLTPETRMNYAVPMWLKGIDPNKGLILNLDDISRAGNQVIQGVYELIHRQEFLSWKLPEGSTIICTSNIDDGTQMLTSCDEAFWSRFVNFNVKFDIESWAEWAEKEGIDDRSINFLLNHHSELMDRSVAKRAKINARSYTMFANIISGIDDWSTRENLALILQIASGCFMDEDDVVGGLFTQFIANKLDKLITPEELVMNDWKHVKHILSEQLYDGDNYRADIASIITTRFINFSLNYLSKKNGSIDLIATRILDLVDSDKILLTEDLLFNLIKTLNKSYPRECSKLILNPKIMNKLI